MIQTFNGFVSSMRFTLVGGVGNDLVQKKAINTGQKLAEKETLSLKYITANPFPHNCTLPEIYIHLLAPHENKHPFWLLILKIGTGA